ncbi:MAG: hypothetical protein ACOYY3_13825 [Chloroflexota bacterium]
MKALPRYLLPRLRDTLFISLLAGVLLYGPRLFNLDGDLGRHITIGRYILAGMQIPTTDIFSHTLSGQPLTPHEWLAQVIFAAAHAALGLGGPVLVTALVVAVSFTLVYLDSQRRSRTTLIALGISILAAAASSLHWLARPHVFTFLYLAVWVWMLERLRRGEAIPVRYFGLVMLLWANTHGAFIAGFVAWGAYLGGDLLEAWSRGRWLPERLGLWSGIGLLSFAVTFINPAGARLWETSFGFVGNEYLVSHTHEYQPPNFHQPGTWPFLIMVSLSVLALGLKKGRLPAGHALLLAGWTAMGLYSARNIPLYAIVAAPVLSETVAGLASGWFRWAVVEKNIRGIESGLRGWVWPGVSLILGTILLASPAMRAYNAYDPAVFPVKAADWLESHPQEGNVFNYFPWGGYLLYRFWPEQRVFIDGQTDFYGESLTREYEQVLTLSDGMDGVLEKYAVDWVIFPANEALADTLMKDGRWNRVYSDETTAIFRLER